MEAEAAIDASMKLFCPNPKCSMLVISDVKQHDAPLDCPHCNKAICTACGVLWHVGLTCEQFQVCAVGW
jgi:E3 ubiquitin-protein ligase RNF144